MKLAVRGATVVGLAAGSSFGGDVMSRQYLLYDGVPVGEDALQVAGWTKHDENGCDPHLGFGWTKSQSGATQSEPYVVYTTAGGQQAGVGIIIKGNGRQQFPAPQQRWASSTHLVAPRDDPEYAHIDVAFRSGSIVCSGETGSYHHDTVGDVIIVNPAGPNSKTIPLTEDQSEAEGWRRGSCFDGMGWHRFFDTSRGDGTLSWRAKNLFPVVAMYDQGKVSAMFFASTLNQVSVQGKVSNGWEARSLGPVEMCMNTCDSDCKLVDDDTPDGVWSTLHFFLKDHSSVKCPASSHCAVPSINASCCEASSVQV